MTSIPRRPPSPATRITGMYFPKQTATGTHCEAEDGSVTEPNTIAAVHSHVNMQVFFSAEDQRHMNHSVEMVVNARGDILANARIRIPCGNWHRGAARVVLTEAPTGLKEYTVNNQPNRPTVRTVNHQHALIGNGHYPGD